MRHLPSPEPARLPRRRFIVGATAASLLAACGGGSDDGASTDTEPQNDDPTVPDSAGDTPTNTGAGTGADTVADSGDLAPGSYSLIQRFIPNALVSGSVRVPFSLSIGVDFVNDGPAELGAQLLDIDGNEIERLTATRRDVTPAAYYAFRAQIDEAGIYTLVVDGGPAEGANFQVFAPDEVPIPGPGDVLPGFDTPTVDEPAGVDPICTREPNCDFHGVSLTEALDLGRPVAYFVGTPAFCQTGSCTPALEALIAVADDYADDIEIVHAEVWTDLTATSIAPAVSALSMNFEPALFVTDSSGTIVERIDGLWDESELRERLDAALEA